MRDSIMGRTPADWDVCTSARPEQIIRVFNGVMPAIPTGIKHGTITILSDKIPVEVTTFRIDGSYSDNRRDDQAKNGYSRSVKIERINTFFPDWFLYCSFLLKRVIKIFHISSTCCFVSDKFPELYIT